MSRRDQSPGAAGRAVALRYDGAGAPVVVASGMGYLAEKIVDTFLDTEFSGVERHQRRVDMIEEG